MHWKNLQLCWNYVASNLLLLFLRLTTRNWKAFSRSVENERICCENMCNKQMHWKNLQLCWNYVASNLLLLFLRLTTRNWKAFSQSVENENMCNKQMHWKNLQLCWNYVASNLLLLFLRLTTRNWKAFSLLPLRDSLHAHLKQIHAHPRPSMLPIRKLCASCFPIIPHP